MTCLKFEDGRIRFKKRLPFSAVSLVVIGRVNIGVTRQDGETLFLGTISGNRGTMNKRAADLAQLIADTIDAPLSQAAQSLKAETDQAAPHVPERHGWLRSLMTLAMLLAGIVLVISLGTLAANVRSNNGMGVAFAPLLAIVYIPIILLANIFGFSYVRGQRPFPARLNPLKTLLIYNGVLVLLGGYQLLRIAWQSLTAPTPGSLFSAAIATGDLIFFGTIFVGPQLLAMALAASWRRRLGDNRNV